MESKEISDDEMMKDANKWSLSFDRMEQLTVKSAHYAGQKLMLNKISSLIPKWRKVEEGLPKNKKPIRLMLLTHDNEIIVRLLSETSFIGRRGEENSIKEIASRWMPESELLNLIPK